MPDPLNLLYALEHGDNLSADQCAQVNASLVDISAKDVPLSQIANVRSYLDLQLLLQQVDPDHIDRLERLASDLDALD